MTETVVVLDFETTGLYPQAGDRPTEVAAVIVHDGRIEGRFHSLMNAGVPIHPFVEELTGITNRMIKSAPPIGDVMRQLMRFIGTFPLVAHNASFDRKFLDAELRRLRRIRRQEMLCSMLLARRVYPDAPNHKLATLSRYAKIPSNGRAHRALADATTTAQLWMRMIRRLREDYGLADVSLDVLQRLQAAQRAAVPRILRRYSERP